LALAVDLIKDELITFENDIVKFNNLEEDGDDLPPSDSIDKQLEEYENKQNDSEVENKIIDTIHLVGELKEEADMLETYVNHPLALECGQALLSAIDNIRVKYNSVFDKNGKTALNLELTNL
jgi:hypothetical protein